MVVFPLRFYISVRDHAAPARRVSEGPSLTRRVGAAESRTLIVSDRVSTPSSRDFEHVHAVPALRVEPRLQAMQLGGLGQRVDFGRRILVTMLGEDRLA